MIIPWEQVGIQSLAQGELNTTGGGKQQLRLWGHVSLCEAANANYMSYPGDEKPAHFPRCAIDHGHRQWDFTQCQWDFTLMVLNK